MFALASLLASTVVVAECSWNNPGADRYQGRHAEAIQRYDDIPANVRNRLSERMRKYEYDDIAEIRRDGIQGTHQYSNLRDMHFGKNKLCRSVDRSKWSDAMVERGLVYCEESHCIIVPTICGNVSRVTRIVPPPAVPPTSTVPPGPAAPPPVPPPENEPEVPSGGAPSVVPPLVAAPPMTFENGVRNPPPAPWVVMPPLDPYRPPTDCCSFPIVVPPPIPEPKTILLFGLGLAFLTWLRRK